MITLHGLARLFKFDRPLVRRDPTCVAGVLGIPDNTLELMAAFNRFEPYVVCAPLSQGKRTLLHGLHNLFSEPEWDCFRARFIAPTRDRFASREKLSGYLALAIGSDPRAKDFEQLLRESDLLAANRQAGLATILLIDTSECVNRDVLAWLAHSVFLLGSEFRELASELRVLLVLSGAFDESMFATSPPSKYAFRKLILRNLTLDETTQLFRQVSESSEAYGGIRFETGAIEHLFNESAGDKRYTNVLGAKSILEVEALPARGPLVITRKQVSAAVRRFRSEGSRADKIIRRTRELLSEDDEVATALHALVEHGSTVWTQLGRSARQRLFEVGAVGPAISNGRALPGAFGLADWIQDGTVTPQYEIRNPMIRDWLADELKVGRGYRGAKRAAAPVVSTAELEWEEKNAERLALIDKQYGEGLAPEEQRRLDALQAYADEYVERVTPLPWKEIQRMEQEVEGLRLEEEDDELG